MILTALCAILIANCVSCERILVEPLPGVKIPLDVSYGDGVMIVVSGQPDPPQDFFSPSINLYDFDMQLEARKVENETVCYIRKFTETLDAAESIIKVTEELNIPGDEIPANELEATVGAKIALFCSKYTVCWLAESQEVEQTEGVLAERKTDWSIGGGYSYSGGEHTVSVTFTFGRR